MKCLLHPTNAYSKNKTLAAAVRHYVNELFGKEGIVVVDADHRELKKLFRNVIQDDLFQHTPKKLVEEKTKSWNHLVITRRFLPVTSISFISKMDYATGLKKITIHSKLLIQK